MYIFLPHLRYFATLRITCLSIELKPLYTRLDQNPPFPQGNLPLRTEIFLTRFVAKSILVNIIFSDRTGGASFQYGTTI